MKLTISAIGKMKSGPESDLIDKYLERSRTAGRQVGFSGPIVAEHAESRAATIALRRNEEAEFLAAGLGDQGLVVALDEKGVEWRSGEFAKKLGNWRDGGSGAVGFAIGGADGLDPKFVARATIVLSLSRLTLPHQIARIVVAEQIYRAITILSGHPYHRDG